MKALGRVSDQQIAAAREAEKKVVDETLGRFVWALAHASKVNDDGLTNSGKPPEGWTEEEIRWATDVRKSKRFAPFHVCALSDIFQARLRAEAALSQPPKVELNIGQIVQVQPRPLKVIDVETE